ncbi:transposase [Streptomyces olivaceus]|uniref:transposase n=1 Tax=Streptomyces olivaceus TaxID=47716 RepID=UPI003B985EF8
MLPRWSRRNRQSGASGLGAVATRGNRTRPGASASRSGEQSLSQLVNRAKVRVAEVAAARLGFALVGFVDVPPGSGVAVLVACNRPEAVAGGDGDLVVLGCVPSARGDQLVVGPGAPLTDAQWARIEPLLPDRTPKRGGRWRGHREVIDAIAYKSQTGTQWV